MNENNRLGVTLVTITKAPVDVRIIVNSAVMDNPLLKPGLRFGTWPNPDDAREEWEKVLGLEL